VARTVEAGTRVPLGPEEAADLWRDPRRWPGFVEGLQRIERQDPDWPREGSRVVWVSGAGGRGTVTEKVTASSPTSFTTLVAEKRLFGTQTASFRPAPDGGALAQLKLEYELTGESPLQGLTDLLFIRRALRDSLTRTLRRFAVEAQEDAALR
jgi:hypothetical protein